METAMNMLNKNKKTTVKFIIINRMFKKYHETTAT